MVAAATTAASRTLARAKKIALPIVTAQTDRATAQAAAIVKQYISGSAQISIALVRLAIAHLSTPSRLR